MDYTIRQLADLAGISTRTLRYYDEIGLLTPSFLDSSGYRRYRKNSWIFCSRSFFTGNAVFHWHRFLKSCIQKILTSPPPLKNICTR